MVKSLMAQAVLALSVSVLVAEEAFVVKDGKAVGQILVPANPPADVKLAADELSLHLQRMSGTAPAIADDPGGPLPAGSIRLSLAPEYAKATYRDGRDQSFVIDQTGGGVLIEGQSTIAILYGAYEYLSDLGVRWFVPGDVGTHVPAKTSVPVSGLRKAVKPGFRFRSIWLNGDVDWHWEKATLAQTQKDYALWMVRNRLQGASKRTEPYLPGISNIVREAVGHNIRVIYKWKNLTLEKDPERFPLVTDKGKKGRTDKGQICFTHPDNISDAAAWCLEYFTQNPHMVSASMSLADTGGICECDACRKANGGVNPATDANRLVWGFMNEVARRVGEAMPGKGIAFYSGYGATTKPPAGMRAETNIVGSVAHIDHNSHSLTDPDCPYEKQHLEKFRALKAARAELFARDYTMYPASLQPLALVGYVKTYRQLGCVGYSCEVMARSEHHMMVNWAQAQMAWNPDRDPRQLIEEFCLTMYGDAGTDVLAVVDAIEASVRQVPRITLGGFGSAQEILTEKVVADGRGRLDAAAKKVTGVQADRLTRFRETFELYSRLAQAYRALFLALDERTPERQKEAVGRFDEALAYWKAHDMGRVCSPQIVSGWIDRVRKTAVELKPVAPKLHAALEGADEAALRSELFALAVVPPSIDGLVWLPSQWKFRVDPGRKGESEGWMKPGCDDSKWVSLALNHFDDQGFLRYEGTFWYRAAFSAFGAPIGKRIMMRIGALDDDGRIYINGQLAYTRLHLEGADWKRSFEFDATDYINPGPSNVVAICGRNDYGKGGLWKPVAIYFK